MNEPNVGLLQKRPSGASVFFTRALIVMLCIGLYACATSNHNSDNKLLQKTTNHADYSYPNLTTRTGMGSFLFLKWTSTAAYWPASPPRHSGNLEFVVLSKGHAKNWHWTILIDKSLLPYYRRYSQSSPLRWGDMITLLRHVTNAVFRAPLPPVHFTLRMAPADKNYQQSRASVTRNTLPLSYAFPFPSRFVSNRKMAWSKSMILASSYLSHETALALLMDHRLHSHQEFWYSGSRPGSVAPDEAIATLFNMYFSMQYATLSTNFGAFLVPPMSYGYVRNKISKLSVADEGELIGGQVAGLVLAKTFGKNVVICANNLAASQKYQDLLSRLTKNRSLLKGLKKQAINQITTAPPTNLELHTTHALINVPVRFKGRTITLGGVFWPNALSMKFHGHAYRKERRHYALYKKACTPEVDASQH